MAIEAWSLGFSHWPLKQRLNHAAGGDGVRALEAIVHGFSEVKPHAVVNSGVQVGGIHGMLGGIGGVSIRSADDLPGTDASAGEEGAAALAPMVASGITINLRRATEFAEAGDKRLIQTTTLVKVLNER
tara:strand:+ start:1695 stop:2081 length:387 start_codon:yes stop_codon:yes gene_type:complete